MAFWVVGGSAENGPYIAGGKRRVSRSDGSDYAPGHDGPAFKRSRISGPDLYGLHGDHPVRITNLAFLVLRQRTPTPEPEPEPVQPGFCPMERTASGLSISSDTRFHINICHEDGTQLLEDGEAAWLVAMHMANYRRRSPDSQHERILKALLQPRSREAEFTIDNDALESIFSAANEIFFYNRLSHRVRWDWSHSSSSQYQHQIIGTTALRRSKMGGYETLIVLSQPILKDRRYNRRLLISTFLHELIHSYLFICCGFKARACGGHTAGFRRIAEMIDRWVGEGTLHLRNMEADLNRFIDAEPAALQDGERDWEDARRPYLHYYNRAVTRNYDHDYSDRGQAHYNYPQQHCPFREAHPPERWDHAVHDRWGEEAQGRSMHNVTGSLYV